MKTSTLKDLLVHEARFLYNAEQQIISVVPQLLDSAATPPGAHAILNRLQASSEEAIPVLHQVMQKRDAIEPFRSVCQGVLGIFGDAKAESRSSVPSVGGVELYLIAQRLNQYQLAGFLALRTYAFVLGYEYEAQRIQNVIAQKTATGDFISQASARLLESKSLPYGPICRQIKKLIEGGWLIGRIASGVINAASSFELQLALRDFVEQSANGQRELHAIPSDLVPFDSESGSSPGISAMLKETESILMADLESEATDIELSLAMLRVLDYLLAGYRVSLGYFEAVGWHNESSTLTVLVTGLDNSRTRLMQLSENLTKASASGFSDMRLN